MGVMDEYDVLNYNEVFIYLQDNIYIEPYFPSCEQVLVSRNPCFHLSDMQVVNIKKEKFEKLKHLKNVIVFPQKIKKTPIPSRLSGGDLDGDMYYIQTD